MKKFKTIVSQYKNTSVLKGSRFLYCIFFWKTKALSFLQQRSSVLNAVIHTIVRVLPKPTFVIKNNSGTFLVQAFDDSTTICSDYFEAELRDWLNTPSTKDVFVDIGANRGIYTILAPTQYGYSEVHAFEPNPEVMEVLHANVALNQLESTVSCHQIGAGDAAATLPFTVDPMHKGGGHVATSTDKIMVNVDILPLDTALAQVPTERLSFIKIDTEGFEFSVLKGMPHILKGMQMGACIMIESTEKEAVAAALSEFQFALVETKNHDHLFQKHA